MSEMNVAPATEAASSDTQDFLSSVGESEKRVRVSGKAVSDEVVLSTKAVSYTHLFTPDAEFPVCNAEKGQFGATFVSPKIDGGRIVSWSGAEASNALSLIHISITWSTR